MTMTSNKPYLVRAIYDWIVDNELTPYLLVNAAYLGVQIPQEHVVNGRIVLNISPSATRGLLLENDRIVFSARFSGKTEQVFVPPGAVLEIYARENGRGIAFEMEEGEEEVTPPPISTTTKSDPVPLAKSRKPSLKLVD